MCVTRQPVRTSTPSASSCSRARCDSCGTKRAEHAVRAFEQHDARRASSRCGGTRRAACAARSRPSCRPSRRRSARRRSRRRSATARAPRRRRSARRVSNAPITRGADVERVGQRLQARRMRRPVVVAEVAVRRAGRDDQVVVGERLRRRRASPARAAASIAGHLGLQHGQVAAPHLACAAMWRIGALTAGAVRPAVATWYSSGWNRWWLVRSTSVISTSAFATARAPPRCRRSRSR